MAEDRPRYSVEDIDRYFKTFKTGEAKAAAYTEIVSNELLKGYLNTTEGRLVFDSVIDGVRSNMMKIVSLAISGHGFDENIAEIKQAALQISAAYDFMYGIVVLLDRGKEHEKGMAE